MRLLVTGADGQVGWELRHSLAALGEVIALGRDRCDLTQPGRLPGVIRDARPDVVVNAAAYTAVDQAEQEEQLALLVNGTAVGVLAAESRRIGALLLHYSTDYVFDGNKNAPYTEEDAPCPINAYGRSKLAGEKAVREFAGAYVILRTSWVYAARGRNFVRTMLRLAAERDELQIVDDQVGAPTWARDIAQATARLIRAIARERAAGRFAPGLFHLTAAGATSWYGFAEAILACAKDNDLLCAQRLPQLRPVPSEHYPRPATRPKNSRLAGELLKARFGIVLPHWQHALSLCMKEMRRCQPYTNGTNE